MMPERMRWRALFAVAGLVTSLVAGCGNRQSHDEIVRAWNGGATSRPSDGAALGEAGFEAPVAGVSERLEPRDVSGEGSTSGVPARSAETREPTGPGRSVSGGTGRETAPRSVATQPAAPGPSGDSAGSAPGHQGTEPNGGGSGSRPAAGEVVIGNVSTLSGPVGATVGAGPKAIQAWVAAANARGGVHGYTIKLHIADDGSDPARHRSLVQEMAERDGVVAFVGNAAPLSGQGAVSYIEQRKVPVIGSEGGSRWMLENTMYFPQVPTFSFLKAINAGALAEVALPAGKSKIAVFICEFAECKNAVDPAAFSDAGFEVVHDGVVSLTSPDYTADCLAARNAGAETVFLELDPPSVIRFGESCANVGLRPLYGLMATSLSDAFLARQEFEGTTVGSPNLPFFHTANPSMAEFRETMSRYAPDVPPLVAASTGWVSAKLLERVLERMGVPQPTPADVLKGLWSIRNDDLDGLTIPLTFEPDAPNNAIHLRSCWWTISERSGQWTSPNGGQRQCRG